MQTVFGIVLADRLGEVGAAEGRGVPAPVEGRV